MTLDQIELAPEARTLSPLLPELRRGLVPVAFFGLLSFISSLSLFLFIAYRLITWRRRDPLRPYNQFIILIFNLLLADIQQAVAFLLNIEWLVKDQITVGSSTCWAQGWFVSTGDLASGVWCLAIGVHTFGAVVLERELSGKAFMAAVGLLWASVYLLAIIGIAIDPHLYVRAGAWCWVDARHSLLRLWLHYFWIFIAEFGTIAIYAVMYVIVVHRIRTGYYATNGLAARAQHAARIMIIYPLVYVVCTLPLASARMASMNGFKISLTNLCVAGAMITSNGWLDVLLYTLTRRVLFLNRPGEDASDLKGLSTFAWNDQQYGNTTIVEARARTSGSRFSHTRLASKTGSMEELVEGGMSVKTTVAVTSEPVHAMELADLRNLESRDADRRRVRKEKSVYSLGNESTG